MILVDSVLEQGDRDRQRLSELRLTLKYCLETHIHADHIPGTANLQETTGCAGIVPEHSQSTCASGRTDFQSGNAGMLYDSVTQRLLPLLDTTEVYPGHDYRGHTVSTIGEEK